MGQTSESSFPPLNVNNKIIVDEREKTDLFNTYFSNASTVDDTNAEIPLPEQIYPNKLNSILVTADDIKDQLAILDTSKCYGPDGVSPKLVKEAGHILISPLQRLFNLSLNKGKFPKMWKQANVLPIFKKGNPNDPGNYRPVSLLCCFSKIFERIIFKYVYNHLIDHYLISMWQSGFRPGFSTVTQLTELYHKFCEAVSQGKEVRCVFLDISKAFDRVWHKGLIVKLQNCGLDNELLSWFTDYLKDRSQRVLINGQTSNWIAIQSGVPQGSVLGPLLFLVYINDLVPVVNHCNIRLYADDACLFIELKDHLGACNQINHDLERISDWANKWLVNFSPEKCKSMIVSNKHQKDGHPPLQFDGTVIKQVIQHMHLGVILSHNLKWSNHIEYISNKANKRLNLMKKFKYDLDRRTLEIIYFSFVRPILEYADMVWSGAPVNDLQN